MCDRGHVTGLRMLGPDYGGQRGEGLHGDQGFIRTLIQRLWDFHDFCLADEPEGFHGCGEAEILVILPPVSLSGRYCAINFLKIHSLGIDPMATILFKFCLDKKY